MTSEMAAPTAPMAATYRPAWPSPGRLVNSAVRATFMNECGSGGAGGTWMYFLRPDQKNRVAISISTPGMPKAIDGP